MTKGQITLAVNKWQKILNLEEWDIQVNFEEFEAKEGSEDEVFKAVARTLVNTEYLSVNITIKESKLYMVGIDTVVHELCHILTQELAGFANSNDPNASNWASYFEERLVTRIERLVLKIK